MRNFPTPEVTRGRTELELHMDSARGLFESNVDCPHRGVMSKSNVMVLIETVSILIRDSIVVWHFFFMWVLS